MKLYIHTCAHTSTHTPMHRYKYTTIETDHPLFLASLLKSNSVEGDVCRTSLRTHVFDFLCMFPVLTRGDGDV